MNQFVSDFKHSIQKFQFFDLGYELGDDFDLFNRFRVVIFTHITQSPKTPNSIGILSLFSPILIPSPITLTKKPPRPRKRLCVALFPIGIPHRKHYAFRPIRSRKHRQNHAAQPQEHRQPERQGIFPEQDRSASIRWHCSVRTGVMQYNKPNL